MFTVDTACLNTSRPLSTKLLGLSQSRSWGAWALAGAAPWCCRTTTCTPVPDPAPQLHVQVQAFSGSTGLGVGFWHRGLLMALVHVPSHATAVSVLAVSQTFSVFALFLSQASFLQLVLLVVVYLMKSQPPCTTPRQPWVSLGPVPTLPSGLQRWAGVVLSTGLEAAEGRLACALPMLVTRRAQIPWSQQRTREEQELLSFPFNTNPHAVTAGSAAPLESVPKGTRVHAQPPWYVLFCTCHCPAWCCTPVSSWSPPVPVSHMPLPAPWHTHVLQSPRARRLACLVVKARVLNCLARVSPNLCCDSGFSANNQATLKEAP